MLNLTSWNSSETRAWLLGLYSEAFRTTVFPQKMATATARTARASGAFQGAIDRLMPSQQQNESGTAIAEKRTQRRLRVSSQPLARQWR